MNLIYPKLRIVEKEYFGVFLEDKEFKRKWVRYKAKCIRKNVGKRFLNYYFREDKKLIPQMNGTKNLHFGIKLFPPLRKFHTLILVGFRFYSEKY